MSMLSKNIVNILFPTNDAESKENPLLDSDLLDYFSFFHILL